MKFWPYLQFLVLAACAAPSIGVTGGQSKIVDVGAFSFVVNYKGDRAEAYRSNVMWSLTEPEVFDAGATAMEQVTGCRVVRSSLQGDVGIVRADLLC